MEKLAKNHKKLILYSRIYFVICIIAFVFWGTEEYDEMSVRLILAAIVLSGHAIFFSLIGINLKMFKSISKESWDEMKKIVNFQLNFMVVFFGGFGLAVLILLAIIDFKESLFMLLLSNVILAIATGALKNKSIYIYESEN
ncbi:hypothetical protein RBH29_09230 [Herbivorax sp. ANBcel31]|uniref:hypothetical protein n=1 Tax=Herbivorax sp. ANBcel31 TaxID=3069754 RepID=UPI0027AE8076|nr:hypothetical protein [Herbivorax sp. ANBcel31]MDQ2086604.1 hypothetical protein [Herbivorax sp. ANBcel31]